MDHKKGRLWLIPNSLDPDQGPLELVLPAAVLARIAGLRRFVVEGERAAWRLLSRVMDREALAAVSLEKLDEHSGPGDLPALLAPLLAGEDVGLLSEAGLPCIADPGAALVAAAHAAGIRVFPLTGPSSILLALSASGLDGQRFSFVGYLPQDRAARRQALQAMERTLRADGATRIFIETPYRNDRLLEDCLEFLSPDTRLCVAAALTTEAETIRQARIDDWRSAHGPIGKIPAIFLVGNEASTGKPEASTVKPQASTVKPQASTGRPGEARRKLDQRDTSRDSSRRWKSGKH